MPRASVPAAPHIAASRNRAAAGVFLALWQHGLAEYDALQGIDWQWLAIDGARTKAPLGGKTVAKSVSC